MHFISLICACFILFIAQPSAVFADAKTGKAAVTAKSMEGVWLTKLGRSHVKIEACENKLCNEIVWLKQPNDRKGNPHTDKLNKDRRLRGRPIIGISILLNMRPIKETYWKGWIYDPEKGKAFAGHARLINANKLEIKGCHSFLPICKTHIWKKVSEIEDYKIETQ